jgi:molybdate transport system ATP-binding protein
MLRDRVRQELADLQARFRIPLVVISHDVDDVKMFAETLVVYGLGEVSHVLPCKTLREQHGDDHAWREMAKACGLAVA